MLTIVIIGAGVGGVTAAKKLQLFKGVKVILIDRKTFFEVTYAQLRAMIDPMGFGKSSRFSLQDIFGQDFIQGEVTSIEDTEITLSDNRKIGFDKLVIAPGSSYPQFPLLKSDGIYTIETRNKYNEQLYAKFVQATGCVVVGGGVVGVELAGELATFAKDKKIRLVHRGERLIPNLVPAASAKAMEHLQSLGVEVLLNADTVTPLKGEEVFYTTSPILETGFLVNHDGVLNQKREILVDEYLTVKGHPHWYAIGDAAAIDEAKHGLNAKKQALYIAKRIVSESITQRQPTFKYKKSKPIALVPIGSTKGFLQTPFGIITWKFLIDFKRKDFFINDWKKELGIPRKLNKFL